ncbi:MAG: exodeoxyribonuclease VII large subunit [Desulfobacterales bacterium]|nr:MAG: exodeoxyribonuclease VII large subunit [Desulfobacterales bacterium]
MFDNSHIAPDHPGSQQRKIYSVSELNAEIKILIEESFPFVWIYGEISNFRIPVSGHFYFTLKDSASQIGAVMFRGQQRNLKFMPEDGMSVTGMGRLSVYEPRGTYQIILEYLEPSGIGALQIAFEKLKRRLAEEGCFDEEHKRSLPFLPKKISIITSPTGAVVHDIRKIIHRRFPNVHIQIIPAKVQGHGAVEEIVAALKLLNSRNEADVAILARGGGSLEDLQAFNTEQVARAIFASKIPIVSAVGHETDYTISDFVADLRAPTPSTAAELVVPEKTELERRCNDIAVRLRIKILNYFNLLNKKLSDVSQRLIDPRRRFEDYRLRLDDLWTRLNRVVLLRIRREREYSVFWRDRLAANTPQILLEKIKKELEQNYKNLIKSLIIYKHSRQIKIRELTAKLEALNPLAILARGYSVTRTIPDATVVKNSQLVALNQEVEVMLAKGRLFCRVEGKTNHGKEDI